MGYERHIIGVPGGGKTQFLIDFVQNELLSNGVPPDEVFVVTFTVAAAQQFAQRAKLPASRVGTLHSVAFRALGMRPEELAHQHVDDWNERYRNWPIRGGEDLDGWGQGDILLGEVARLRGQEVPYEYWPVHVQAFNKAWERWKAERGLLDFVDIVEIAPIEKLPRANWIVVDEAQDLTPLEMRVIRRWASRAYLILAGDPNQSIYGWRGGGGAFDVSPDERSYLTLSKRLPRRIAERAMRLQVQRTTIEPRGDGGEVGRISWDDQGFWGVLEFLGPKETAMFLATARKFLAPVIAWAYENGVPFSNVYSPDTKRWNPLVGACETFRAWERGKLTYRGLLQLVNGLNPRAVPGRGALEARAHESAGGVADRVPPYELEAYMIRDVAEAVRTFNVVGLLKYIGNDVRASYPLRALHRCGLERVCSPRITIGTIHSVKGAEADVVATNFALTSLGEQSENVNPDEVRRVYYVAVTRAKRALYLARRGGPAGGDYYQL